MVNKMQIPRKQKILTLGLFAIGSAGVVFSIIRIVAFTNQEAPSNDPSYDSIYTPLWVALEGFISLMCAAAMAIRPLLTKFIPSLEGPRVHRVRAPPRRIFGGQRGEMEEWQQPQGQVRLNFIKATLSRVSQRASQVVKSRGERLHLGSADDEEAEIGVGVQPAPRQEVEVKERGQRDAIEVKEHARACAEEGPEEEDEVAGSFEKHALIRPSDLGSHISGLGASHSHAPDWCPYY
ncbi:hypothetical protein OPT61_g1623 [Boeremia exigua]|uniref:Uncharacterized protein n=1 Tax=Boeremia exigua TaxID=749465 RepID=A0ACC2IPS7_9PLEO|nr:hypothetical protein OPT61_g1623 [Boeremia exigua]